MKVKDKMNSRVVTVEISSSVNEAFRLMKENNVRRLPVMDHGRLVGIITLSDLNHAMPSAATSLSIHELNYILAKTTIGDILPKKQRLITVDADNYIETAARLMRDNKISGLPVVEDGKLVGIITETDIFDSLIQILGVTRPHTRIDLFIEDKPGVLADITRVFGDRKINILNTVVYFDERRNLHKAIIRVEELNCQEAVKELEEKGYKIESVLVRSEV
ncbi:CBS and ACT domain-containing protein [Thermosyntropha sp.]|uniref:CBS and ACT domain-containing protein n=1 Tax=Thermosyntropha sp. TaxID=2740820 RepID=UPI0025F5031D|nr:CBS and ACT domain-containing protein [Thermosyntropha sp.]MBO8159655.1 CBS domain-containing protein [Thermosyntropha sp.]